MTWSKGYTQCTTYIIYYLFYLKSKINNKVQTMHVQAQQVYGFVKAHLFLPNPTKHIHHYPFNSCMRSRSRAIKLAPIALGLLEFPPIVTVRVYYCHNHWYIFRFSNKKYSWSTRLLINMSIQLQRHKN